MEDRGRKVICHGCKEKFYKDELNFVTKSKRLCKNCEGTIQVEADGFRTLVDYMCKGFNQKAPTGQQLKHIKEFKELGYTYFEIQYTLYYIYSVLKKKPEGTSIGLVPFYYERAKEHCTLIENAKRTANKNEVQELVINRNQNNYQPNIKKTRLINIEELI